MCSTKLSFSLLDKTVCVQARECGAKGEGPSNIWSLLCGSFIYLLNKQWRDYFLPLAAALTCDLQKWLRMSHINRNCFSPSTRTKLLCCEQRGLYPPVFSNPYRPLLQMSWQRCGRGLRGERWRVLTGGGWGFESWHCSDFWKVGATQHD